MERRKFSREFKLEAVNLVRERGVSIAQTARDLDVHYNLLRGWVKELGADPQHAFPGLEIRNPSGVVRTGCERYPPGDPQTVFG